MAIILLSIAKHATAETNNDALDTYDKAFKKYISEDKQYIADLRLKAHRLFTLTHPECEEETAEFNKQPPIIITQPQYYDYETREQSQSNKNSISAPSYGQWIENIDFSACNTTSRINILASAVALDRRPSLLPLLNGTTRVMIYDQIKAEDTVKNTVKKNAQCVTDMFITNTEFIGYRSKNKSGLTRTDDNRGWIERWTVNACENDYDVNLAVLPDPKTQFRYISQIAKTGN